MTLPANTDDDFTKQLAELDKIRETCAKLLQTKHYSSLGESGIHAIMARAKALGIHPFEALNGGFYCINGKVGMSTEMMSALIRQRGHSVVKDPKSNNEIVILHGKRSDNGDTWTCSFGRQDAEAAGLWNTATWKKYPGVMLYNRCMSMLFRQLFSDLSLGAGYIEDELKEITKTGDYSQNISSLPEVDIEVIEEKPKNPSKDEISILKMILSKCPQEFVIKEKESFKYESFEKMPIDEFNQFLERAKEAKISSEVK
jgi:hypothetical protein